MSSPPHRTPGLARNLRKSPTPWAPQRFIARLSSCAGTDGPVRDAGCDRGAFVIDSHEREYYSIAQAAAHLGVSRGSVSHGSEMIVSPQRTSDTARFVSPAADLERFLAGRRRGDGAGDLERGHPRYPVTPPCSIAMSMCVQFFESDAALIDAVSTFVGDALTSGDIVIVIATAPHREAITARLQRAGITFRPAGMQRDGSWLLTQPRCWTVWRSMGHRRRARCRRPGPAPGVGNRDGTSRPRIGEMVALLAAQGNSSATIALEECWNARSRPTPSRCCAPTHFKPFGAASQATLFQDNLRHARTRDSSGELPRSDIRGGPAADCGDPATEGPAPRSRDW